MFKSNPYGMFSMPTLETPRLILRRIAMKDAQDIFDYSRDTEVARHVLWSAQKHISEAKDYCRYMMRRYKYDEPSSWGIILKESGKLVGTIGYMTYSEDNNSVELGYSLARPLWNGGYMTEALSRVIEYTFEAMEVNRIEAQHELTNPASGRVMEKCGMQREGVLRQRLYNKGKYVDVALYAILREDWRPGKKNADSFPRRF
ncbi:MAG: GNAT family N-acetyltransferase [Clostridia bacterium]|nr:GNAT family N-acetyltransferase [Clostridia bacterium]